MSDTATHSRGGDFATSRRGGLSLTDMEFARQKLASGVSRQHVANMLRCPVSSLESLEHHPRAEATTVSTTRDFPGLPSIAVRILRGVCDDYGIQPSDLLGDSISQAFAHPRQDAYYRLNALGGYSRYRIASLLKRDNSTVRTGIENHRARLAKLAGANNSQTQEVTA